MTLIAVIMPLVEIAAIMPAPPLSVAVATAVAVGGAIVITGAEV